MIISMTIIVIGEINGVQREIINQNGDMENRNISFPNFHSYSMKN